MRGNYRHVFRMCFNKEVWKTLLRFHRICRGDPSYSLWQGVKMVRMILKGEKIARHGDRYVINTFMPPFPSKAFDSYIMGVNDPNHHPFSQHIQAKRSAPISVYLSLTHRCPFDCFHCSAEGRKGSGDLTLEQWQKVIVRLQAMKVPVIGLTGGEPMCRDDLLEIVSTIDDSSSSILFTSGMGVSIEKAKALKKAGLFSVGISLDSWNPMTHDEKRRSQGAFEIARQAIQNCSRAGLYTMVQSMVTKKDVDRENLFKLFSLAKSLGANEVKMLEPIPSGKFCMESEAGNLLDQSNRRSLIAIQQEANASGRFPKITSFPFTESFERYGCGAGTQHSYIDADGRLYPCDFVPLSFRNVLEQPVDFLWKEMNRIMGLPKPVCFAREIQKELQQKGLQQIALPLDPESSRKLCLLHQNHTFPGFYRKMQGRLKS